jgi:queuine tRNA-ribosyltransferase
VKELLGAQIATLQNLSFFLWLVNTAREKIIEGTFSEWKESTLKDITRRL